MAFTFRPAVRENMPVLWGVAGGTGSGKTYSALRLATGLLEPGERFAVIDTENGRALHYADDFAFDHCPFSAPFTPARYVEAIAAADKAGYPVIVVDSASHEYTGVGGLLDWHEEELTRMAGTDWKRREAMTFAAWVKPKAAHKAMVSQLLQVRAHIILCFRASEKIEIGKDADGKTVVRPKKTLTGLDGWVPEAEKNLPYELTGSLLLTADRPGVPKPVKLQEQHRALVRLDQPLSEETGRLLGEWARGGSRKASAGTDAGGDPLPAQDETGASDVPAEDVITEEQRRELRALQRQAGVPDDAMKRIVADVGGVDSSALLPADRFDAVVEATARWEPPPAEELFKAPAGAA